MAKDWNETGFRDGKRAVFRAGGAWVCRGKCAFLATAVIAVAKARFFSLPMVLGAAVFVQGCSIAIVSEDIESTDLSPLTVGATRVTVESVLGKPIRAQTPAKKAIAVYAFNEGSPGEKLEEQALRDYLGLYGFMLEPILTPIALVHRQKRVEAQKGYIMVLYGPEGTVGEHTIISEDKIDQAVGIAGDAVAGVAEGQYQMALLAQQKVRAYQWMCLAANQGHARAQVSLGDQATPDDPISKFKWYALAEASGDDTAAEARIRVSQGMRPDQLAEADRLVKEWRPDPDSCESVPVDPTIAKIVPGDSEAQSAVSMSEPAPQQVRDE